MSMDMMETYTEDVLLALNTLEETIQVWKAAVVAGGPNTSIARGPFSPIPIPGPPPPFSGCEGIDFLRPPPHTGCLHSDIDIYVQQVSGLFLGIYYGLEHDHGGGKNL